MMWVSSTKPKREGEEDQGNHEERGTQKRERKKNPQTRTWRANKL
jgi:hypothetical protein